MSDTPTLERPDTSVGTCRLSSVLGLTPLIDLYGQRTTDETPVDDPLTLMQREEEARQSGDRGVSVRRSAAENSAEVTRLANEALGPLNVEKAHFEANGYGTVFARWTRTIETKRDEALDTLGDVNSKGLTLSEQFKSGETPDRDMLQVMVDETARAEKTLRDYTEVLKGLADEVQRERVAIEKALESFHSEFLRLHGPVEADVTKCLRWDYPGADKLDKRLKDAFSSVYRKRESDSYRLALVEVRAVKAEVATLMERQNGAYETKMQQLNTLIQDVERKVKEHERLRGLAGSSLNTEQITATQGKVEAARALGESGRNAKALDVAIAVAREAQILIDAIDDPSAKQTLKDTKSILTRIEKKINEHKKIRANDATATKKLYDDLKSDILGISPNEGKTKVETFEGKVLTTSNPGDWTTYQGRAQNQIKWKTDYEKRAGELEVDVRKFNAVFGDRDYSGSMITDLSTLRGLVGGEANENTGRDARVVVTRIEQTIERYRPAIEPDEKNVQAAVTARDLLVADQTEAMRQEEALKKKKEAFESKYGTIKSLVDNATSIGSFSDLIDADRASAADYEACKELVKSARKTADDSKDYTTAINLLNTATKDLTKLKKRSTGELFDDLKKMGRVWKAGVATFATNVGKLKSAMTKAIADMEEGQPKTDRQAQIREVSTALDNLVTFFQPTAFDDCASRFDGLTDAKARKREREEVLRRVRLYRDAITGNPLMKSAVGNPFGVTGIATSLYAQLNKIELMTMATL